VIIRDRLEALITIGSGLFANRTLIMELATRNKLPTMAGFREFVEAGGLLSYGYIRRELFRQAATYVVNILKGADPASLPVELPTKYELVINLKTA
jgi:putative ABC transport system substrate-binding protein